MSNWLFLYQVNGGEEAWEPAFADKRQEVTTQIQPAFVTVLDLSGIPNDHDWSKVKYKGPLYFDFDADGDLERACSQFKSFLGKLDDEYGFDISQARLFASGGKGFHIEIPPECFHVKVPNGTHWLPYIYKNIAEAMVVDTMDMRVYTGKRGRMWRTPNVVRENGNYKVSISVSDALDMTPELYLDRVSSPMRQYQVTPPSVNTKLAVLYDRCRDKVTQHMRGRKKRVEKANAFLEPWRLSGKVPPTIEALMRGENVGQRVGFNLIAMQLAIYATSVGMDIEVFLEACKGLCENYIGDSDRYGSYQRRREQLADQYRYMESCELYEFAIGPIVKLLQPGTLSSDLGGLGVSDTPAKTTTIDENGNEVETQAPVDPLNGIRRGVSMNYSGIFKKTGDNTEVLCRAHLKDIEAFKDADSKMFKGYEFRIMVAGNQVSKAMVGSDVFTSSVKMKNFFAAYQLSFQGGDFDTIALLDICEEKAVSQGNVFIYPREGFFVLDNPLYTTPEPVMCYLTQDHFQSSIDDGEPGYFRLRYRPTQAISTYNVDIHKSPELCDDHIQAIDDLFNFSANHEAATLVGWFVACHYRSLYLKNFKQFPLLQVYGEAGAGKSQTVMMLSRLHWYLTDVSVKSASSCTPFAMDTHASTSTSAPFIIDEYKPRELKQMKGRYEKFKDVIKASYVGGDIGERGTINRGAESNLAIIKSKATAPIVFMGEAIEMETAIVERSCCVNLSKRLYEGTPGRTAAFERLRGDATALSALGKKFVELGFDINIEKMRSDVLDIVKKIEDSRAGSERKLAQRIIFNRAVIIHSLTAMKYVLHKHFGDRYDARTKAWIDLLTNDGGQEENRVAQVYGISEVSKVLNRMAMLTRNKDLPWELRRDQDYTVGDNWVEIKVDVAYDAYRRWCASIHETPLFDTQETWLNSLNSYSPATDRQCAGSSIREVGGSDKIVRFDLTELRKEGVGTFKV